MTQTENLAYKLRGSMNADHRRIQKEEDFGESARTEQLRTQLMRQWADRRGLVRHGLDYRISAWPAWHFPGSVLFVEWTAREQGACGLDYDEYDC
jgi:hypothetical protein